MSEKEKIQKDVSNENNDSASKILNKIYNKNTQDNIEIGILLQSIDSGGFALLILIFALLLVIPTPPPIPTIAALIIMFFSLQMVLGIEKVWLPKFITQKEIKRKTLAIIVEKSSIYLYKLEGFTRRRFMFMSSSVAERVIGFIIFFLSAITLTPIIFANSIPGVAIILISFGILNKDGFIVILGFLVGIFSIFVVSAMVLLGKTVVLKIIERFF